MFGVSEDQVRRLLAEHEDRTAERMRGMFADYESKRAPDRSRYGEQLTNLTNTVNTLDKHVVHGNGEESLLSRMTKTEEQVKSIFRSISQLRKWVYWGGGAIITVYLQIDQQLFTNALNR